MYDSTYPDISNNVAVRWRHPPDELLADWRAVQLKMARFHHPEFTRGEWAYLLSFCSPSRLLAVLQDCLWSDDSVKTGRKILRPPARVGVWLPNNVSLLGPLSLVLLSLTGCQVWAKAGSKGRDCCLAFIEWLRENCPRGPLLTWLERDVKIEIFSRTDDRNRELAGWSQFRMFFGSDEGASSVEMLPHPPGSRGFYFSHRTSEAWVQPGVLSVDYAKAFARVFGLYGRAGCTSPLRVVVIDGDRDDARGLAESLADVWPAVNPGDVPRHVASEHVLAIQLACAVGKNVRSFPRCAGFAAVEHSVVPQLGGLFSVSVQWGTLDEAVQSQSKTLQTIGYSVVGAVPEDWRRAFRDGEGARLVPLERMHEFGPVWDGIAWFRQLFTENIQEV